ncbi:tetratricopeptide repeat-containing serine protease family protein [Rhodoferax sp. UBA5149]|uniref:tetratricopeptide repeat-containing serine protease family protein n=1 Tax=Rhodoferax sp. UBA5149 TaxID=1947379 RepID=UPI0025E51281|nr:tetratricopeptide repeat-containing serine protease family protein [Rhodoferax sp. UBA5149]
MIAAAAQAGMPEGKEAFAKAQYADARKELAEPASQGDAEAMALMGDMLMRGRGGPRDELKAREYILQAHENGSNRGTFVLGLLYLYGNLVNKNEAKGIELVKQAAEKGYAPAQSQFGAWIGNGVYGYEKNETVALTWFKEAATQKDASAMNWLGFFYENGKAGLAQDPLIALDWYKKSAELHNTMAMVSTGRLYALGRGVSPDGAEALRWFKKAAALGSYQGYAWIASVYEFGRGGLARNPNLAYAWYAAVPSNVPAELVKSSTEGRERLAKILSQAEQDEAGKQSKTVVAKNAINALLAVATAGQSAARKGVYGSGVVVSRHGDIVTNEHVVQHCEKIRIQPLGTDVKVIAKDAKNDLALLRLEGNPLPASNFRVGKSIRLGDEVVAIGYPLRGLLSSGPIVTTGIVNALSGANDDTSAFQMSATVQPGSSGGPIFDNNGLLVGIVRARLLSSGPIGAQNVNFGINLATVSGFLDAHAVDYSTLPISNKPSSVSDITAQTQKSTVQIECY